MARGGVRNGAGRKPGSPNKATAQRRAEIEASGITPLDYMLAILRNEELDTSARFEAAKAAAPYVHARLSSIEASGPDGGPIPIGQVEHIVVDAAASDAKGLPALAATEALQGR